MADARPVRSPPRVVEGWHPILDTLGMAGHSEAESIQKRSDAQGAGARRTRTSGFGHGATGQHRRHPLRLPSAAQLPASSVTCMTKACFVQPTRRVAVNVGVACCLGDDLDRVDVARRRRRVLLERAAHRVLRARRVRPLRPCARELIRRAEVGTTRRQLSHRLRWPHWSAKSEAPPNPVQCLQSPRRSMRLARSAGRVYRRVLSRHYRLTYLELFEKTDATSLR